MRLLVFIATGCLLAGSGGMATALGQEMDSALRERRVLEEASRLDRAGQPEEAMQSLEAWLDREPGSVSALLLLSQIAERADDPGRALARAEEAVRLDRSGLVAVRQIWIRTLSSAGLSDSARRVARSWTEESPDQAQSWMELSALEATAGDPAAAAAVLREGREKTGSGRLFVQELAALEAELGQYDEAAREWRTMLSWGEPGVDAVSRGIVALSSERGQALDALRDAMREESASVLERRGAVEVALSLGEYVWAREMVEGLIRELPEAAAEDVLRDYVGESADAGDPSGASWAAQALAEKSRTRSDEQYWLGVSAAYAADAGASERARAAFERLRSAAEPGSDLHELSLRRLHEMKIDTSPAEAEELLREYRSLYPDAGLDLVVMSVRTADAWMDRGDLEAASTVLDSITPADPLERALQAAARGRLEILAGRPERARGAFELAATGVTAPSEVRVEALRGLALLDLTEPEGVRSAARLLSECRLSGDFQGLVAAAGQWASAGVSGGDRLAAFAAGEAEASGEESAAAAIRREIVNGWPESSAAPRAMLELARLASSRDPGEARMWLERLIVDYPESVLAPVARRMLAGAESEEAGV